MQFWYIQGKSKLCVAPSTLPDTSHVLVRGVIGIVVLITDLLLWWLGAYHSTVFVRTKLWVQVLGVYVVPPRRITVSVLWAKTAMRGNTDRRCLHTAATSSNRSSITQAIDRGRARGSRSTLNAQHMGVATHTYDISPRIMMLV